MKLKPEQMFLLLTQSYRLVSNNKELREGQAYMNALFEIDQKLYNEITGTDLDPFYDDSKINTFFDYLKS